MQARRTTAIRSQSASGSPERHKAAAQSARVVPASGIPTNVYDAKRMVNLSAITSGAEDWVNVDRVLPGTQPAQGQPR
jgi:hypothetical protein